MIPRIIKIPKNHSFFLFGPRQTGKSTLLKHAFKNERVLFYNLLISEEFLRLKANPTSFREEVISNKKRVTHVIVDEVQRVPQLLNEVHQLMMEPGSPFFCLSGSSSRKLKKTDTNLLAGRAWTLSLHSLTHCELKNEFSLQDTLSYGSLPEIVLQPAPQDKQRTLRAYVETYLKEEIWAEAVVRNTDAFVRFINIASDFNGEILNYSNIARETGTSYKTVKEYFQILEDTLIGDFLFPFSRSKRKGLVSHPKFYFFDNGVHRALAGKLTAKLTPKTYEYGKAFEHFFIKEAMRLSSYLENDYKFSFYRLQNGTEVDLIIETPEGATYAIEIKATDQPQRKHLRGLKSFRKTCPHAELICACQTPHRRVMDNIQILPWKEALEELELIVN